MLKQVGAFTLDTETGTVTGPATYMREQGSAYLKALPTSEAFRRGAQFAPDVYTAILVFLQTDYAAWRGMQSFAIYRES
jgi:hypothetical protein